MNKGQNHKAEENHIHTKKTYSVKEIINSSIAKKIILIKIL